MRPRIATPLDHYASTFAVWFQGMWPVWLALIACIMIVVASVAIHRARQRAHASVPHYRRETGPIPVQQAGRTAISSRSRR